MDLFNSLLSSRLHSKTILPLSTYLLCQADQHAINIAYNYHPKQSYLDVRGMSAKLLKTFNSIPTICSFSHSLVFQLIPTLKISILKNLSLSTELAVKDIVDDSGSVTPPFYDFEEETEEELLDPDPCLLDYFEEKCPPGGDESVVLYTTSLTGIRKTYEDCKVIRFVLQSFRVIVQERDVSMHIDFREELWRMFNDAKVIPPRLFIKGMYIGGANEALMLHEQGKLMKLLEDIPLDMSDSPCSGCANLRFVVCINCHGSRKAFADGDGMMKFTLDVQSVTKMV